MIYMKKIQYNCIVLTKQELYNLLPNTNANIDINYNWLYNKYGCKYDFNLLDESDIINIVYHITDTYYIKNFYGIFIQKDNKIILKNADLIVLNVWENIDYQYIINDLKRIGVNIDIDFLNNHIGILKGECVYEYR